MYMFFLFVSFFFFFFFYKLIFSVNVGSMSCFSLMESKIYLVWDTLNVK
uniref:ATP synthase F0 subunit 8 n=1 Tax=Aleurochiton aceris TaxID=266942 RepID=Q697H7_ALEAC|nr:ATP synthase F0 subunit 8 [Aleurochiton aceris]